MTTENHPETLTEFVSSLSYGSRTDLNFKFLAKFSAEEVAQFFQELLRRLGQAADTGDYSSVHDHVYQWQMRGYAAIKGWTYEEGPFTPLQKPLTSAKLALLTSSGHFVVGDDPKPFGIDNMDQEQAMARINDFLREEPQLSAIPLHTTPDQLRVRHGGYDIAAAQADHNVALPIDPLRALAQAGQIGALAEDAYSFVGACAQTPLLKQTAPAWAEKLRAESVDAVLLVPV